MLHSQATDTQTFPYIAGRLCLDFANTLGGQRGGHTREYLSSYDDLVSWSEQAGILTEKQAGALLQTAQQQPGEAAAVLEKARVFREVIYRIFAAVVLETSPAEADLAALNAQLGKTLASGRIISVSGRFSWDWAGDASTLDSIFGPLARSAAELLTSPEHSLLRECASDACSWLFVDHTKNHRRRWCTTTGCGNVAKVRRHRQRLRLEIDERPS